MPRTRLPAALAGSCVAIALTLTPMPAAAAHRPQDDGGSLVLVGGGLSDDNAAVYDDIVRLAGGPGRARIGIVTAASSTPAEDPDAGTPDCNNSVCNGDYYAALFRSHGAHAEWIPIDVDHVSAADDPAVVAQVRGLTGFFFGGGDQYRYVTTMRRPGGTDSAVLAAIRGRLNAGAVVAGTSAGAQIQAGADMLTGGESYEGLRDGSAPGYFDDASVLGYLPEGGFGFFRAGLLDTHFSARGRQGRSVRLAADTGHERVFGLDEDTALEVTGVGTRREAMRVIGAGGVHVLDLRQARVERPGPGWGIRDVRWTRLTAGDTYDAAHWRPSTTKPRVRDAGGCQPASSDDVFGEDVLSGLALRLVDGCRLVSGRTRETDPAFTVELTRGPGFAGFRSGAAVSYTGVWLRIH
ncbi:cyanophycinase [Dactylosporangium aurantiacum]|uniref:Cyanophycinase n=1 Tax=Dactylosporangium aurantiacum TaxID=35754 RepID=A0A9Q9MA03_9ACTN|nr:cyanophycinase [Dactylosporangium aurantiacum]MDG6109566.1 cyanophycinase [Dactylosporangium aurantiacum]UWZ51278.1 cyanophycinase [Dactylosporangium aurantiacum]